MTRFGIKWAAALAVGAAVWAASAGTARAQYWGGGPFTTPGGLYNPMSYYPGLYFSPGRGVYLNYNFPTGIAGTTYNPITGSTAYPIYMGSYPVPVYGYIPLKRSGGYYPGAYMGGGVGAYGTGGGYNPVVGNQLKAIRGARPGPQPANDVAARRAVADQWNFDRGAKAEAPAGGAVAANDRLLNAPEDQVLSGKALNDLAAAIRGLEPKKAKAESPLLPAGLLAQVEYTGGPAADALMLLRAGKPELPEPLKNAKFDAVRDDLDRPMAAVVDPLLAGKRVEAGAADKLAAAVRKARKDAAPAVRELPKAEGTAVTRFFDRLAALADVAKVPDQAAGLIVPKWSTVGASAAELVAHLDKYKVAFAPAGPGAAETYDNLYRGLAGYYFTLTQAPVKK